MDSIDVGHGRAVSRDVPHPERRTSPVREALPDALRQCAASLTLIIDEGNTADALKRALTVFAGQVRARGVPPERAIAAFKHMFFNLPALVSLPSDKRAAFTTKLTQILITAYYAHGEDRQ